MKMRQEFVHQHILVWTFFPFSNYFWLDSKWNIWELIDLFCLAGCVAPPWWNQNGTVGRSIHTYYVTPLEIVSMDRTLGPRNINESGKRIFFQNVLSKSGKNWNVQWTRSALYDHNCQNWQAQVENACDDRQPYHSIFSILFVLSFCNFIISLH